VLIEETVAVIQNGVQRWQVPRVWNEPRVDVFGPDGNDAPVMAAGIDVP
jgi:hypothetical protein